MTSERTLQPSASSNLHCNVRTHPLITRVFWCLAALSPEVKDSLNGDVEMVWWVKLFGLRSWTSLRLMSLDQRIELMKRMEEGGIDRRITATECAAIAKNLNLSLEQVSFLADPHCWFTNHHGIKTPNPDNKSLLYSQRRIRNRYMFLTMVTIKMNEDERQLILQFAGTQVFIWEEQKSPSTGTAKGKYSWVRDGGHWGNEYWRSPHQTSSQQ